MMNRHGTGFGNLGTAAAVREGFIQVAVYFENMNIEHIYETPSYEVENLLGDIGGQLGLWMGISIMTVIELAEFLTDVVLLLLYRRKKSAQPDVEADLPRNPDAGLPGLRRGPADGLTGLPRGPADGLTGFPRGPAAGPPGSQFILLPRDFPMSRIVPNYPVMKGSWRNSSFTDV
ncbi:acid-sensing ion channel 1-like [Branchiostoma lanceolatum]|uniref:acid-sensing ion channel 1-like n=1 Tax=Branchiostoma lanceolatum TaxID=7740 RepID=UPI003454612A